MGRIFISYRRRDEADAGRLYESLAAAFGGDALFKDVDSIGVGRDFRTEIERAIDDSVAMILVIGRGFADDAGGEPGLAGENDYVRLELQLAHERGVPILPLLVGRGVSMPIASRLPANLDWLSYLHAAEIEHSSWSRDLGPVIDNLRRLLEEVSAREAGRAAPGSPPGDRVSSPAEDEAHVSPVQIDAIARRIVAHLPALERVMWKQTARRLAAALRPGEDVLIAAVTTQTAGIFCVVGGRSGKRPLWAARGGPGVLDFEWVKGDADSTMLSAHSVITHHMWVRRKATAREIVRIFNEA